MNRRVDLLAQDIAGWLARHDLRARTVTVKVRHNDFTTVTRSHSSPTATHDAVEVAARARGLLDRTEAGQRPVRLLGVSLHNLVDAQGAEPGVVRPPDWLPFADETDPAP